MTYYFALDPAFAADMIVNVYKFHLPILVTCRVCF